MRVAIVGCGFVADFYAATLKGYPELELLGATDRDPERARRFTAHHDVPAYRGLDELLADPQVDIVVNLTNPDSHYSVSRAALEHGKHVYSEKPLAMEISEARELVKTAEQRGLRISSAPCTLLGETAQTLWKALREQTVGPVRLVYAELDDGLVHRMPFRKWSSASGAPWPYEDEFSVGCTIEHAGYQITWLLAFFGPARTVTAFSACLIPDKGIATEPGADAPDFSVACIRFASGVVARLTCSIIAPHDHSLRIFGEDGVLSTGDCWHDDAPVHRRGMITVRKRLLMTPWRTRYPLVRKPRSPRYRGSQRIDFARGIAELGAAVREGRPSRLSAEFCLHANEVVLAIHGALDSGSSCEISSSFEPLEPMPWAR